MKSLQISILFTFIMFLTGCSSKNPRLPKGNPYKMVTEVEGDDSYTITYLYKNNRVTKSIMDGDTNNFSWLKEGEYMIQMQSQGTGSSEIISKQTLDGTEYITYLGGMFIEYSTIKGNIDTRYLVSPESNDTISTYVDTIPDESNPNFTFDSYGNCTSGPGFKNTWYYN